MNKPHLILNQQEQGTTLKIWQSDGSELLFDLYTSGILVIVFNRYQDLDSPHGRFYDTEFFGRYTSDLSAEDWWEGGDVSPF